MDKYIRECKKLRISPALWDLPVKQANQPDVDMKPGIDSESSFDIEPSFNSEPSFQNGPKVDIESFVDIESYSKNTSDAEQNSETKQEPSWEPAPNLAPDPASKITPVTEADSLPAELTPAPSPTHATVEQNSREESSYNLRSTKPNKRTKRNRLADFKRTKISSSKMRLNEVDVGSYHPYTDDVTRKLLDLTKRSLREQVDKFVYDDKCFVVMSWLNTARLFEYKPKQYKYSEIQRIPQRYIPISPQIITCLHYNDSKFYLGHLWGNKNAGSEDKFRPYVERRDSNGQLLDEPCFYDHVLQSIRSNKAFVFVLTNANSMYIHSKIMFNQIQYFIDFTSLLTNPIIETWVENPSFKSFTRLPLVTATTKEIILTQYDAFEHRVIQCHRFDDKFNIVSVDKLDKLIIILRKSPQKLSKIEFGFISKVEGSKDYLFVHEVTASFKHDLIHIKQHKTHLYVLGESKGKYELGCIHLPSLKPIWCTQLKDVDNSCLILPHDDHVAIVGGNQDLIAMRTNSLKLVRRSMLHKMTITTNKHLQTLGASIFQKLQ